VLFYIRYFIWCLGILQLHTFKYESTLLHLTWYKSRLVYLHASAYRYFIYVIYLYTYPGYTFYISSYFKLAGWKLTFVPHSKRTHMHTCASNVCVPMRASLRKLRFDEYDLVAFCESFNGIPVLPKWRYWILKRVFPRLTALSYSIDALTENAIIFRPIFG